MKAPKLCLCFVITGLILCGYGYIYFSSIIARRHLAQVQEDLNELSQYVYAKGSTSSDNKILSEMVDKLVKKRLSYLFDDIYSLKKQVLAMECSNALTCGGGGMLSTNLDKVNPSVNYASEALGAKIKDVIAEPVIKANVFKSLLRLDYSSNPPVYMIRQNMEPGNCFGFRNNKSEVTIKLARKIKIETIELEHLSKVLSPTGDITSAPKNFRVFGLDKQVCDSEVMLGKFKYDNNSNNRTQTFKTTIPNAFQFVKFKFDDNYGHPDFTCVYRVAVFGT